MSEMRSKRAKTAGRVLAVLCLFATTLGYGSVNSAGATSTCTGNIYSSDKVAQANFEKDCGEPFRETTAFGCTWVPGGWQCKGPGEPTAANSSSSSRSNSSGPVVTGQKISWPDDGWYLVQDRNDGFKHICGGTRSCTVSPGYYKVTNHTIKKSWNLRVTGETSAPAPSPTTSTSGLTIDGQYISWPNDGWYQVQDIDDGYKHICNGTRFCWVKPGNYKVTNHTKDKRWTIQIQADTRSPKVFENVISWEANGLHIVRSLPFNKTVCSGGKSCNVSPGRYRVSNVNTQRSWVVNVDEPAHLTVDHLKQGGKTYTVFNTKYGSFIISKNPSQVPPSDLQSSNGQQTYNRSGRETVWINHNPQKYESPEQQTGGTGATAFEIEINPDGTLGDLVSVVHNGKRYTPEEWEEQRKKIRDHWLTNMPAGKPLGFIQKAYKIYSAIKEAFGGGGDGSNGPPFELNGPENNWGWGNHPQGEYGGTPTTLPGTNTGGDDRGGNTNTTGNTGGHPTGYDDGQDTGGTF